MLICMNTENTYYIQFMNAHAQQMRLPSVRCKEICSIKQDIRPYIDSCHKQSEKCAAYPEQITVNLKNDAKITIYSDIVIL